VVQLDLQTQVDRQLKTAKRPSQAMKRKSSWPLSWHRWKCLTWAEHGTMRSQPFRLWLGDMGTWDPGGVRGTWGQAPSSASICSHNLLQKVYMLFCIDMIMCNDKMLCSDILDVLYLSVTGASLTWFWYFCTC
jgi:hypothetical protein